MGQQPERVRLKLRSTGSASWVYVFRPRGSGSSAPAQTVTIGSYPSLKLDAARREALRHVGTVAGGGDPAAELRLQRLKARSRVSAGFDAYELELGRRGVVKKDEAMSVLRRGFAPMLNKDIGDIDQPMLIARIATIATTTHKRKDGRSFTVPGAAADFRKHCHAFFAFTTATGLTRHNPLSGYRLPRQTREELLSGSGREGKALADDEIVSVWKAAERLGVFGSLVQLALLSGLRRNELAMLEWGDITDSAIIIPASRTKMSRPHHVPITPLMRTILDRQPKRTGNPLVFPSPVSHGVINGWSKLVPRLIKASGVTLRLHDLRRTTRTILSRLGVDDVVAGLCIGHVRGGLTGLYDKNLRWDARVSAFKKVSDHVETLLRGYCGEQEGAENLSPTPVSKDPGQDSR